ncbi:MAG: hypothetical protein AUG01_02720 [Candidatus Rokubacteria bacterium 13_1_20CM_2_69_58]|nr:MAG: hypothetical protein AUG01_02720 [Candidatus Rokubacteria bacterium 13_1_20CM_2_69_58]
MLSFDRHGHLVSELAWASDGSLARARVRLPDGTWLAIEPRATTAAPWGLADRLWRAERFPEGGDPPGEPLTVFEALDWARIDRIPPLAEPTRLPPGGGTAVLNLIAELARAQGVARLAYRGPYPTEQLFAALLESFRYAPADATDPLAAFMAGELAWTPAPHERLFVADGLYVQRRARVEKVVFRGAAYYRPDWQSVVRQAPKRVRDVPEGVLCSLWALGRPVEDHLLLASEGDLLRVLEPVVHECPARPMPPEVVGGVAAIVAAGSARPLAPVIEDVARAVALEWGAVARDLVTIGADRIRVSEGFRAALAERLATAHGRGPRATLALAAIVELGVLVGDALRARAQARLVALPPAAQAAALDAPPPEDGRHARAIGDAIEALLREVDG